jgi:putative transcription antitermination factor YqgF
VRRGVRMAIDVGKVRVGIARSDIEGLMAVPVATLQRTEALEELATFVADYEPLELVVGLPLNLAGHHTPSTEDALAFAGQLRQRFTIPVRMVDERLSTVSAAGALRQGGTTSRNNRQVIDQVAAVILLQHTLDTERSQGVPAGFLLEELPDHE